MGRRVERFLDWCPLVDDIPEMPPPDAYDRQEREEAARTVLAAYWPESNIEQRLFWYSGFGKLLAIAAYRNPEIATDFDTYSEGETNG